MFTCNELADYLSFPQAPASWKSSFDRALSQYSGCWCSQYDFEKILAFYEFSPEFCQEFFRALEEIRSDPKLDFLCSLWRIILYDSTEEEQGDIWSWDRHPSVFSVHGNRFMPAAVLLSGHSRHVSNMQRYHFDEDQIREQKHGIRFSCQFDRLKRGLDGMHFRQMIWGSGFVDGHLIQTGRLQFELLPKGYAPMDAYAGKGHPVVYVHIPEEGPLTEESVQASLARAKDCIRTYYPEEAARSPVFFTRSWLLSPELPAMLPSDSRILQFQKHFHITEYTPGDKDFLFFVFHLDAPPENMEQLSARTSLQRRVKECLIRKDLLQLGTGILAEDWERLSLS